MVWLLLLGLTLITFSNRYAFFSKSISYQPGPKVRRFLGYSSYAILTAIWAPILFSIDLTQLGVSQDDGVSASSTPLQAAQLQDIVSHAGLDYLIAAMVAAIMSFCRVPSLYVVLLSSALFFSLRAFII